MLLVLLLASVTCDVTFVTVLLLASVTCCVAVLNLETVCERRDSLCDHVFSSLQ